MSYYTKNDILPDTILTKEEEADLFNKFYAGDIAARDRLALHHLKLVAKLALTFAKRGLTDEDAISAGNAGLMQALECRKFDPARGWRFASYVRNFVRGRVYGSLRDSGMFRNAIPREVWGNASVDGTVTGAYACEETASARRKTANHNCHVSTFLDNEAVECGSSERQTVSRERMELLKAAVSRLKPTEAKIITAVCIENKTFQVAAEEIGISRQGAQQSYARGIESLRRTLKATGLSDLF